MRVHFYDVGQALAALVILPDGRTILVDAGESAVRKGCGDRCEVWHRHVVAGLTRDLGGRRIDLVWITHPHSDHLGGVPDVMARFGATFYVDNGRDLEKPAVKAAREAVAAASATVRVVDPEHLEVPLQGGRDVKLTAIVPRPWPEECTAGDVNACSIGLRIDYCRSSVLFTGDAPTAEEARIDPRGEVTLLQVGHHGSRTSTGQPFVDRIRPRYAVVSSAKPYEGTNEAYCHPRAVVAETLTRAMGGPGKATLKAYDGAVKCEAGNPQMEHWVDVPVSDRLFSTARDGDVLLWTTGDGIFAKE
jgi:competence protein ComEC